MKSCAWWAMGYGRVPRPAPRVDPASLEPNELSEEFGRNLQAQQQAVRDALTRQLTDVLTRGAVPPRDGLPKRQRPVQAWRPYVWARLEELEAAWGGTPPWGGWPHKETVARARALLLAIMPDDALTPLITPLVPEGSVLRRGILPPGGVLIEWQQLLWAVQLEVLGDGETVLMCTHIDGLRSWGIRCAAGSELSLNPEAVRKFQEIMREMQGARARSEGSGT